MQPQIIQRGDWVLTTRSLQPKRHERQTLPGGSLGHVIGGNGHFIQVDFGDELGTKMVPAADVEVLHLPDLADTVEETLVEDMAVIIAVLRSAVRSLQARLQRTTDENHTQATQLEQEQAARQAAETQLEQLRDALSYQLTSPAPSRLARNHRDPHPTTEFEEIDTPVGEYPEGIGWTCVGDVTNPETGKRCHRWLRAVPVCGSHDDDC